MQMMRTPKHQLEMALPVAAPHQAANEVDAPTGEASILIASALSGGLSFLCDVHNETHVGRTDATIAGSVTCTRSEPFSHNIRREADGGESGGARLRASKELDALWSSPISGGHHATAVPATIKTGVR